jgi:hypothetical protein
VKPFGGLQSLLTENMRCFLMARFRKESYHEQADGLCELAYIRSETGCRPGAQQDFGGACLYLDPSAFLQRLCEDIDA